MSIVALNVRIAAEWWTYVSMNYAIVDSDDDLAHIRCQTFIWTNAELLLSGPLGKKFGGILIKIETFYQRKRISKCSPQNGDHFVSASISQLQHVRCRSCTNRNHFVHRTNSAATEKTRVVMVPTLSSLSTRQPPKPSRHNDDFVHGWVQVCVQPMRGGVTL